jgi:hypothetical protein
MDRLVGLSVFVLAQADEQSDDDSKSADTKAITHHHDFIFVIFIHH